MNEITLSQAKIGDELTQTVNARDLHAELGVKRDFSNWIKAQILRADLLENTDYLTYAEKGVGGQFDSIEYHLTVDAAKNVALLSNTPIGKEVRKYFIEIEKAYREKVKAEMLSNQPLDIMSWLQPESFLWLGEPGQATMERRYFAVLEAHTIGYPAAARKYGISYEMMQEWMEEMDSRRLRTFGHTLTRFNSWLALKYAADMRVHQAKEATRVARKKLDRANKRLQRLAKTV